MGYKEGRRFEYKVRDLLRQFGFYVVRSAKSAFPDLVALSENGTFLIECKMGKYLKPSERAEMAELHSKYCVLPFRAYPQNKLIVLENLASPRDVREFKSYKKSYTQVKGEAL